jgi:hypothetical protein
MQTQPPIVLLAPRSSRFTGFAFQLAGIASMGLGLWAGIGHWMGYPSQTPLSFMAFMFALGVLMREVGRTITPFRGGVWVEPDARRIVIQGTHGDDLIHVQADAIRGLRHITRVHSPSEDAALIEELEIVMLDGGVFLLGEGAEEGPLLELARRTSELLDVTMLPGEPTAPPTPQPSSRDRFHFRVHLRWALSTPLAWMGLVSAWLGLALMTQGIAAPILGFILASPVALLGCVLLIHGLARRLGSEEIAITPETVEVRFRVGRHVASRRALERSFPVWTRVRPGAARGARLEIVTADGTLSAAGGVNIHSKTLHLAELPSLAAMVNASLAGIPSATIAAPESAPLAPH